MSREVQELFLKLMEKGISQKLMMSPPEHAYQTLSEAYEYAERGLRHDNIFALYLKIAAYRLGHLALQMAGGLNDCKAERELLERALRHFQTATETENNHFGPMPWIMQLPVLSRLKGFAKGSLDAHEFDAKINWVVKKALEQTTRARHPSRNSPRRERHLKLTRADGQALLPVAQGSMINLIELAGYFLAVDYEPFRGLRDGEGDPSEGIVQGESYVLVGYQGLDGNASLRLPKTAIEETLAKEAMSGRYHLVFKLNSPGPGGSHIIYPAEKGAFPRTFDMLHLIAILSDRNAARMGTRLMDRLFSWKGDKEIGEDARANPFQNQFDQALFQARKSLARLLSPEEAANTKQTIIGTPSEGLALAPCLRVLGAVDTHLWRQDPGWLSKNA